MNNERIIYVNGDWLAESDAKISVFDRGFLMADGVYEVTTVLDGCLIDFDGHVRRLHRSLAELNMRTPCSEEELLAIHRDLVAKNNLSEGTVYLQITRGVVDRDFVQDNTPAPTLVLFTQENNLINSPAAKRGLRVMTLPDLRWHRRDIKTIQLLYPSMAKTAAKAGGFDDAWLVEDGFITEGSSNNAYIVKDGAIITRQLSHDILAGITRRAVLDVAGEHGLKVVERAFSLDEVMAAQEAFITSASTFVLGVVGIDDKQIGNGQVGDLTKRLRALYIENAQKLAQKNDP